MENKSTLQFINIENFNREQIINDVLNFLENDTPYLTLCKDSEAFSKLFDELVNTYKMKI